MAGASIRVEISSEATRAKLGRVQALLANPGELLASIGEIVLQSTAARFDAMAGPDGKPWTALSPRYLARKKKNPDKILQLEGDLRNTMRYQLEGTDAVLVGSNRPYAAIHQFGGKIGAGQSRSQSSRTQAVERVFVKKRAGRAPSAGMPARPYLGLDDLDRSRIVEQTQAFIRDVLGG